MTQQSFRGEDFYLAGFKLPPWLASAGSQGGSFVGQSSAILIKLPPQHVISRLLGGSTHLLAAALIQDAWLLDLASPGCWASQCCLVQSCGAKAERLVFREPNPYNFKCKAALRPRLHGRTATSLQGYSTTPPHVCSAALQLRDMAALLLRNTATPWLHCGPLNYCKVQQEL